MEQKSYFAILARRWRSAVIVMLVVISLGLLGSMLISPKYQAETTLRMITPLGGSTGGTNYETTFANRLVNTYAEIATSEQVMNELKQKMKVTALPEISVNIIPNSEIILISVESSSPSTAARTANSLAEILISYRDNAVNAADSAELNLLAEREDMLQAELVQYQQEHEQFVQVYSQTTADIDVLRRTIQLRESSYQSLLTQYEQTIVNVAAGGSSTTQRDALAKEIDRLESELDSLNQQFKDLSIKSNEYLQRITLLRLSIQSTQNAYSNLLDRYDAAQLAHFRQENAQNMIIVSPAFEPTRPSGPGRSFILGLGIMLGLIAGIITGFLIDYLDPRVYSPDQIGRLASAPIIASVSKFEHPNDKNLRVQRDYWILRARLQALMHEQSVKTILVTSPNAMEGKSTITHEVAVGLAQNNMKVLVVDANLRTPRQHVLFDVTGEKGIYDYLSGEQDTLKTLILKDVRPGVDLLPSLIECDNAIDLLQSRRMRTLFESLKAYDVVLFDTPALLEFPDAFALAKTLDAVAVITQQGHTTADQIQSTCSQLESVGARILGIVFNKTYAFKDANSYLSDVRRGSRKFKEAITSLFRSRHVSKAAAPLGRGHRSE